MWISFINRIIRARSAKRSQNSQVGGYKCKEMTLNWVEGGKGTLRMIQLICVSGHISQIGLEKRSSFALAKDSSRVSCRDGILLRELKTMRG